MAREQRVQKLGGGDADVVGLARDGDLAVAIVLEVRGGRLIGRKTQRFTGIRGDDDASLLEIFATRYYLGRGEEGVRQLPREILLPAAFPDREVLEGVLTVEGGCVYVTDPSGTRWLPVFNEDLVGWDGATLRTAWGSFTDGDDVALGGGVLVENGTGRWNPPDGLHVPATCDVTQVWSATR